MGDAIYAPLIRDMTWSFSRIKQFESCPYGWYLKYICELTPDKELFFSSYGSFMHELLERYLTGETGKEATVLAYLLGFHEKVLGRAPSSQIFQNYFSDGLSYLRSLVGFPGRIVATEQKLRFSVSNIPLLGFIDCVVEDDEGLSLIDHKSRALKQRSNRQKPTKSDEELDEYLKQLYLYAAAVKQSYGVFPKTLCFNCFRRNLLIKERFDPQKYAETEQWLVKMVSQITDTSDFHPSWEFFKCNYLCDMHDHCEYHQMNSR